jgi:hypothetical protein
MKRKNYLLFPFRLMDTVVIISALLATNNHIIEKGNLSRTIVLLVTLFFIPRYGAMRHLIKSNKGLEDALTKACRKISVKWFAISYFICLVIYLLMFFDYLPFDK